MAITEVAADVYEVRLPIPFEDGLVNVFLFADGEEFDLLDCGMNSQESLDLIRSSLAELGGSDCASSSSRTSTPTITARPESSPARASRTSTYTGWRCRW